jgi:Family of unknown function (DUF6529)
MAAPTAPPPPPNAPGAPVPSTVVPNGAAPNAAALLGIFGIGAAVAVLLGVWGAGHDPTGREIFKLGFSGTDKTIAMVSMKVWLATFAVLAALFQIVSALWMWGRLPGVSGSAPRWVAVAHRWSGTVAFVASIPVAYHCLWSIGFSTTNKTNDNEGDLRRAAHSVFGCFFYGVFASKMLALRSKRLPGWTLPVVGSITFTSLVVIWATSSAWWFANIEFPAL